MKLKLLFSALLILTLTLFVSGCSNNDDKSPTGATVTDESSFNIPDEEGDVAGTWTAQKDELTSNRYFYGNGLLVTIEQNVEGETWCFLSTWSEDNNNLLIETRESYSYDTSNGTWDKQEVNAEEINKAYINKSDTDNETIDIVETLPNGIEVALKFKRGSADLELPDDIEISTIINNYLMQ